MCLRCSGPFANSLLTYLFTYLLTYLQFSLWQECLIAVVSQSLGLVMMRSLAVRPLCIPSAADAVQRGIIRPTSLQLDSHSEMN